jgi:hypothetical protein
MSDTLNPAPSTGAEGSETGTQTGAATAVAPEVQPQELNLETADNLTQIRDYAKGLKKDVTTYKASHEFVSSSFGDVENAKIAHSVYQGFAGEEFKPEEFYKVLEQLSPSRARQLVEAHAAKQAQELSQKEVEKLFGGKVSPEEVKLFKQFKESGYGLGEGEDLPDALKFNADGTPKTDEEIAFFKSLQQQVKDTKSTLKTQEQLEAETKEQKKQEAIQERITTFSNDRLKVLDSEFATLGLAPLPADTAEVRQEKEFARQFLVNGISGMFLADQGGANDYNAAMAHIRNEESLLARRYEPNIEAKLLEIFRSKTVSKMLENLTNPDSQPEVRPEISNTGASTTDNATKPTGKPETANELYARLVREGKIKP